MLIELMVLADNVQSRWPESVCFINVKRRESQQAFQLIGYPMLLDLGIEFLRFERRQRDE